MANGSRHPAGSTWWRERLAECEGFGTGSIAAQQVQLCDTLMQGRAMPFRDPPKGHVEIQVAEPLLAPPHDVEVIGIAVNKVRQRFQAGPDGQIDRNVGIVERFDIERVVAIPDQPPDKPGGSFGNRVYAVDIVDKFAIVRMVRRQSKAGDVDLGNLELHAAASRFGSVAKIGGSQR